MLQIYIGVSTRIDTTTLLYYLYNHRTVCVAVKKLLETQKLLCSHSGRPIIIGIGTQKVYESNSDQVLKIQRKHLIN